MNVNEMNTRIESMSQTFRCLNGLNRYRREVDRHQNISNAQLFHGSKVDHQRRINLSLLVKGNSFFAHNRAALSQLSALLLCRLDARTSRRFQRVVDFLVEHLVCGHTLRRKSIMRIQTVAVASPLRSLLLVVAK